VPLFVLLLVACFGCHYPPQQPSVQRVSEDNAVTVTDVRFSSAGIDGMPWYRALVPKAGPQERLPVLYLLHGANSGPVEVMERSEVVNLAADERLIVVIPEAEYSYYTNAKHKRHARWEDAITLDLPRDVERRFPVLKGREHTGIAGISMGGYGAVKLTLKHPEQYGFAGSMSGALDITRRQASLRRWGQTWRIWTIFGVRESTRRDEDVFELLDHIRDPHSARWFDSCGQDDPLHGVNERFMRHMRERGVEVEAMTTPNGHDWQSWNAAMPTLFRTAAKTLR
jgi:putative tributyrin esterase